MAVSRILFLRSHPRIRRSFLSRRSRGAPRSRGVRLLPGSRPAFAKPVRRPAPCYVLHHMGFFVPPRLLSGRWALTPPFHPYPSTGKGRFVFCDTFRHAGFSSGAPAHSTRHAAWWCSDFPLREPEPAQRSSAIHRQSAAMRCRWQARTCRVSAGAPGKSRWLPAGWRARLPGGRRATRSRAAVPAGRTPRL